MCECGGSLIECVCGDRCCVHCGCRALGVADVDYGPVWVEVSDGPPKPPYGSAERVAACDHPRVQQIGDDEWMCAACGGRSDQRCYGCSEPNRCGRNACTEPRAAYDVTQLTAHEVTRTEAQR